MLQYKSTGGSFGIFKKSESELDIGKRIEKEHANTYKWIIEQYKKTKKFPTHAEVFNHIAKDHVKEDKQYYSKLVKYVEGKIKKSLGIHIDLKKSEDDEETGGKKASPATIKAFLKKNPNPSDKLLHEWAEKNGYDIKDLEGKMYRLATKQVKKSVLFFIDLKKAGKPIKGRMGLQLVQTPKGKRWKRLIGKEESPEKKWAKEHAYPYKPETIKEIITAKIKQMPVKEAKEMIMSILGVLTTAAVWTKSERQVYDILKPIALDMIKADKLKIGK